MRTAILCTWLSNSAPNPKPAPSRSPSPYPSACKRPHSRPNGSSTLNLRTLKRVEQSNAGPSGELEQQAAEAQRQAEQQAIEHSAGQGAQYQAEHSAQHEGAQAMEASR